MFKAIEEEKKPIEASKREEDLIASLKNDPKWEAIKKVIDQRIEYLKNLIDPLSGRPIISSKDSVESVGFRFLIASSIIAFLAEIRELPEMYARREGSEEETGGND